MRTALTRASKTRRDLSRGERRRGGHRGPPTPQTPVGLTQRKEMNKEGAVGKTEPELGMNLDCADAGALTRARGATSPGGRGGRFSTYKRARHRMAMTAL